MTENEAIKELETSIDLAKMCTQNYERKNEIQGYEMAIKALEEVQKYRKIGTVEECREAVEKQTAKKVKSISPVKDGDSYVGLIGRCPCCGNYEQETAEMMEKAFEKSRLYDPGKVVKQLEERTAFLKYCTKYGNNTTEQQSKSCDTMMMYEVKDLVDDLLEIVKAGGADAEH